MTESLVAGYMPLWQSVNFQPGIGLETEPFYKDKICPHFDLICKAAALIGIERETILIKEEFCGHWCSIRSDTMLPSGPTTECERIADMLGQLIQRAEPAIKNPLTPYPSGRFRIVIDCNDNELEGKLWGILDRLNGQKPLSELITQIRKLRPGEFQEYEWLKIFREAKKILKQLVTNTMGPPTTASILYQASIQASKRGKPHKRKGCKLHPNLSQERICL